MSFEFSPSRRRDYRHWAGTQNSKLSGVGGWEIRNSKSEMLRAFRAAFRIQTSEFRIGEVIAYTPVLQAA
jgi:hypothetical protein